MMTVKLTCLISRRLNLRLLVVEYPPCLNMRILVDCLILRRHPAYNVGRLNMRTPVHSLNLIHGRPPPPATDHGPPPPGHRPPPPPGHRSRAATTTGHHHRPPATATGRHHRRPPITGRRFRPAGRSIFHAIREQKKNFVFSRFPIAAYRRLW